MNDLSFSMCFRKSYKIRVNCNRKTSASVLYKGAGEKATAAGLVNKNAFRYNTHCRKLCRKGEDEDWTDGIGKIRIHIPG